MRNDGKMNGPDNTTLIRIKLDTYHKLEKIKHKKKYQNLQETGKVGDADFDSIINDLLEKNGNKNYQPPGSGEERTIQGGNKHEQMAEKTSTQSNSFRLDNATGKSHRANETRVGDQGEEAGKIKNIGGEDVLCL